MTPCISQYPGWGTPVWKVLTCPSLSASTLWRYFCYLCIDRWIYAEWRTHWWTRLSSSAAVQEKAQPSPKQKLTNFSIHVMSILAWNRLAIQETSHTSLWPNHVAPYKTIFLIHRHCTVFVRKEWFDFYFWFVLLFFTPTTTFLVLKNEAKILWRLKAHLKYISIMYIKLIKNWFSPLITCQYFYPNITTEDLWFLRSKNPFWQ